MELRFAVAGIEAWDDPGPFDVILVNAVLQWIPDHAGLLPALVSRLASGGRARPSRRRVGTTGCCALCAPEWRSGGPPTITR